MEDYFPNYLRQNIKSLKLSEFKSKGQVVCPCGCEVFDYNYLYFKYVRTKADIQRSEIERRDDEMREKRIGPYQKFVPGDIKFLAGWSIQTFNDKSYWVMFVGGPTKQHKTLKEVTKDPHYIGHFEKALYDLSEPTDFQYIYAKCKHCGKEILLFDDRYYGYDGVCAHYEQPNKHYRADGKLKTTKPHCEGAGYKIYVTIDSTGKDDLLEDSDGPITEENWKDAFEWIKIDLECSKCGKKKNVLNLETM